MPTTLPKPDLSDSAILRFVHGVRPCRTGGLRLETDEAAGKRIVHNYGHGGCGVTLGLGCAEEVVRLIGPLAAPGREPVGVLGGGVTGLTAALALARAGYRVRIYAQAYAHETVSNIAGALWLPTGIDFPAPGPARDRFNALLRRSHQMLSALDPARWGVRELPVYEPIETEHHDEYFESGTLAPPRPMNATDPSVPGLGQGRVFRTLFIDTPRFLTELRRELDAIGVAIDTRLLASIDDIAALPEPVLVNSLAAGSRTIFGDTAMFPARGLLVHMRPQNLGYIYHDAYRYMFPREQALILGGSFEPGITEPPEGDAPYRAILERHRARFA